MCVSELCRKEAGHLQVKDQVNRSQRQRNGRSPGLLYKGKRKQRGKEGFFEAVFLFTF